MTLVVFAAFALVGVIFSAVSTFDFVAHLDRQVHAITCSIVPGLGPRDTAGTSGCHAVLMSPYSSILRDATWGGIPISLPSLGVFAFLLFRAVDLILRSRVPRRETGFMVLAALLPLLTSIVYTVISVTKVGSLCKTCIGIYVASLGVFCAALVLHYLTPPEVNRRKGESGLWGFYFVEGVAMVALPLLLFLLLKPGYPAKLVDSSGLRHPEDRYGVMLDRRTGGQVPAVEVLDPLCVACKGFSTRLAASGLDKRMAVKVVLFPLDKSCNWMVGESMHPGACQVSEAILCAGDRSQEVLNWAFSNQTELLELGRKGSQAVKDRILKDFSTLGSCMGRPAVRNRINKSLRWIVANSLPVLTPQFFVRNRKLPDEDTDLGLDFVLSRMIAQEERR
jgi:uncharacterized membrane protein